MTPNDTERTPRLAPYASGLRADARRNRERVLAAARRCFAEDGYDVPLDRIAARAGVGPGTVYRHFSSKEALFAAVQDERVGELVAIAEEGALAEDPGRALGDFLRMLAGEAAVKRDLPDTLTAPRSAANRMRQALGPLLSRAQDRGMARPDLTVDDLVALIKALFRATHTADQAMTDRLVDVIVRGILIDATDD